MNVKQKGILIISPTISPNIGGVETHLDDLLTVLNQRGYRVYAHAYSPITSPGVSWMPKENFGQVSIWRYRWFGKTLLHEVEKIPWLDFLYITPYLFFRVFLFMIFHHREIDVIHAQGFNAAFIGAHLKKIFKKRLVVSTHAVYGVDPFSKTAKRIKAILNKADCLLALSDASLNELREIGIGSKKLRRFSYWVNLDLFKPFGDRVSLRQEFGLKNSFSVLFVGRLTELKGVRHLVSVAKKLPEIEFIFIGTGPLADFLDREAHVVRNIKFMGAVPNQGLNRYYNAADVLCITSQYEEGFGRVVMEAVACGIPVVGSNKGGLKEALNDSVSILVEPTVENLTQAILKLYGDRGYYLRLKNNCRLYALAKFGKENADLITKAYESI